MKYDRIIDIMKSGFINNVHGFVLIEVLIAVTILSVVLLSVYSGISSGMNIIGNSRNYTKAMVIAKSLMNEFRTDKMKGVDLRGAQVKSYPEFSYDRITERYENPMLGPLQVSKTDITVKWKYKGIENRYSLSMVYQVK
jgi:prepilin-type N-terminal cleavage/methylation domain-containing protein